MYVGVFQVHVDPDSTPWLSLKVFGESEGPMLATCPPALLDATPEPSGSDHSYWPDWRKRCRDFHLMRRVAAENASRLSTLRSLADDGRLIISHIR